ncbi:MAG: hypothetical protein ACJ71I_16735 [Nitrososphaeraceae archaeon]
MSSMNIGNVGGPEDDRRQLRIRIMRELCAKDTYAKNNNRPIAFPIDDDLRGGFDMQYLNQELPIFERETGYIRVFDNGHISLTAQGREHCNNPDEAF